MLARRLLIGLLLSLSLVPAWVAAQPAAVVEGVQSPAWVERGGRRIPLQPGMELRAGDRVFTGGGSRALFKLSEGSLVKLGENGNLNFTSLSPTQEVFRAALRVLEGAFRFTTDIALDAAAFPHLSVREGSFAGTPARLYRVSFSGELGYEINVPARHGAALWSALARPRSRSSRSGAGASPSSAMSSAWRANR